MEAVAEMSAPVNDILGSLATPVLSPKLAKLTREFPLWDFWTHASSDCSICNEPSLEPEEIPELVEKVKRLRMPARAKVQTELPEDIKRAVKNLDKGPKLIMNLLR